MSPIITVTPSNNIFRELGNNTYDYKDVVSELIDNSIAARRENAVLNIRISVLVDDSNSPAEFRIQDDANGIPEERLGAAISPAAVFSKNSLNEHGLGMKQAVASIGRLKRLVTKVAEREKALSVSEFRFGEIAADEVDVPFSSGTVIEVQVERPIVVTNSTSVTRTLVPYLGARYRRFLKPDNKKLMLIYEIKRESDSQILYSWSINEVKPIYFHPSTRRNQPVIEAHEISGPGWKARLTMGYAPRQQSEWDELGIEIPSKFHPYHVSMKNQGLDVIRFDRVILFHQLPELGLVPGRHNDFNTIRGEIDLVDGFHTATTKNAIIDDEKFMDCRDKIRQILNGEIPGPGKEPRNYLRSKEYPEKLPESLLRDRLAIWLLDNPLARRQDIKKEYVLEGIEGSIDILADGEAWEIKTEQASALDVYQLFMYMDVGEIEKGYLVAPGFSTGAQVAKQTIENKHKKLVALEPLVKFPINHPPNEEERKECY